MCIENMQIHTREFNTMYAYVRTHVCALSIYIHMYILISCVYIYIYIYICVCVCDVIHPTHAPTDWTIVESTV